MSSTTAQTLITEAYNLLNVIQIGAPVPAAQSTFALAILNDYVDSLAQQDLTIPTVAREVFPITAAKGSTTNPYTIGTGGDLNTSRPPAQSNLQAAGLVLLSSSPTVEIPRAVLTDAQYDALQIKDLSNPLFTCAYYNPSYALGLGAVFLWPVPDGTQSTSLVLYLQKALVAFTTQTATYYLPPGYTKMLRDNLVIELAEALGRTVSEKMEQKATASLKLIKRVNTKLYDLVQDPVFTHDRRGGYNILSGFGG